MTTKRGLGRGLGALISENAAPTAAPAAAAAAGTAAGPLRVPIANIRRNEWQPRHEFDAAALEELVASIREHGILQPLLVRTEGTGYQLIAGERRLRAATAAGLTDVPVTVMDTGDRGALELALVENLQRQDLNIIEEAEGYRVLADRFELTQEQIAERVGKSRASVANAVRVLSLPDEVRGMVVDGRLSPGHAKVLAGLDAASDQLLHARGVVREGLSVRQLEERIQTARKPVVRRKTFKEDIPVEHVNYLSDRLHAHFGSAVRLTPCRTLANGKKAHGTIEIDFYSNEDLDRIMELIGLSLD